MAPPVAKRTVVSYTAFPPLHALQSRNAVYFCCTSLGVASTGRYPASCPVKPGLSSPVLPGKAPGARPRSFIPLTISIITATGQKYKYFLRGLLFGHNAEPKRQRTGSACPNIKKPTKKPELIHPTLAFSPKLRYSKRGRRFPSAATHSPSTS